MQEIKKRRIVLASVLKPVNDPRMFEKMGQSLSAHYEVHIIGDSDIITSGNPSIIFHPLSYYTRLSFGRITAPLRILKKILTIKPHVLIICTHELLWMVFAARIFTGCLVVYDIRENYFRNILFTDAFPRFLRLFIASYVRIKEWITFPLINFYFLAEAGYDGEISFVGNKKVIIENKVKRIPLPHTIKRSSKDGDIHLLFSGTLATTTGVFVAIEIAAKLHALDQRIRLHIVGFSPLPEVYREIKNQLSNKPFIQFTIHEQPVHHREILVEIMKADFGIIAYPPNLSTKNTIPTKLYEYMGYQLPILLIHHPEWADITNRYHAAVLFDAQAIDAEKLLRSMTSEKFYTSQPTEVLWETEEQKLLQAVATLK